jgi:hypothetical protein
MLTQVHHQKLCLRSQKMISLLVKGFSTTARVGANSHDFTIADTVSMQ